MHRLLHVVAYEDDPNPDVLMPAMAHLPINEQRELNCGFIAGVSDADLSATMNHDGSGFKVQLQLAKHRHVLDVF